MSLTILDRIYSSTGEKDTTNKATVKKQKNGTVKVTLNLTEGELLALRNGMKFYGKAGSPVGQDVAGYVQEGINTCLDVLAIRND